MTKTRNIIVLILIFSMACISGCSSSAVKKPSTSTGQKPKAPTELKSITTDLDQLISELDKKFKMEKMSPMQQNIQLDPQGQSQNGQSQSGQSQSSQSQSGQSQGGQAQSGQSQGGQSQGGQSQSGQSQSGQSKSGQSQSGQSQSGQSKSGQSQSGQSQAGQSQQTTDWQKEFSTLKDLHTSWNSLMPAAIQAGMNIDSRNLFAKALDQLTQDISQKKLENSIADSLILYKNNADLAQLFTLPVPAEFYQVKYETMAAIFEASRNKWTTADEHVPKFKERWLYFSAQAKDADPMMLSRTEFAIMDLEQAIQSRQMELVIIKGEIVMNNLKSLEEKVASKTSSQGQGQSSGGSQSQGQ